MAVGKITTRSESLCRCRNGSIPLADRYLIEHVEVTVSNSDAVNTAAQAASGQAQADDWNYRSEDTTIKINKVQSGSGADKVT